MSNIWAKGWGSPAETGGRNIRQFGKGNAWSSAREVSAIASCFIDGDRILPRIVWVEGLARP
jgi:hypothetical protein